jgi:predicted ATPase
MSAISQFLGRDAERAQLAAWLRERRLVTVVGPGGIGKTRLAEAVCDGGGEGLPGRVLVSQLAALEPRAEIGAEVAGQLGFPSLGALVLGLGDEPALLLLDNCEHVRPAAAALCRELLAASAGLRVLATSREPLGVDGETLLVLGPLALPDSADRADVLAAPATRLFEERARSAGARAAAAPAEWAAITELCRRLDGVPLAIELAAARARSLTPAELLAHLDRRFDLLKRAEPVGRSRHASLRAAIDTSYELLEPDERAFFRALGVFAGPFGAELAHAVAAPPGADRLATVDLLSRLVDRSLVTARPRSGSTRYALLDSLRHYAAEQSEAAGEWPALVDRFIDAMRAEADAIVAEGTKRWTAEVLDTLFVQLANLVTAIDRCRERDADAARSFRIALPLWGAIHQGRATEVAAACERILARWPEGGEPLRAEVCAVAASASQPAGRPDRSAELGLRVLRDPKALPLAHVIALRCLGIAARERHADAEAAAHFRSGAERAAAAGLAPFARELAVCAALTEGTGAAVPASLAALDACAAESAKDGDRIGVVWAGVSKTHVLLRAGRLAEARSTLDEAARARADFAYPYGAMVIGRLDAALTGLERGWTASCAVWRNAIDLATGAGELAEVALTLRAGAALARRAGDAESARILLAAVPPGAHTSVNGGLFDEDAFPAPGEGRPVGGSGALRRARERLAEVGSGSSAGRPTDAAPARGGALIRSGDVWTVHFAGRGAQVRHVKGIDDLAALLAAPGEEIHSLQLIGAGTEEGDAGPVLDDRARREYQSRVHELQTEIDEAHAAGNDARAERAEAELDALVSQLSAAFGIGGRARRAGSAPERARSAVAWRIRAAVKRIAETHPELGRHLENAVKTGTWCSYRPDTDVAWDVRRTKEAP